MNTRSFYRNSLCWLSISFITSCYTWEMQQIEDSSLYSRQSENIYRGSSKVEHRGQEELKEIKELKGWEMLSQRQWKAPRGYEAAPPLLALHSANGLSLFFAKAGDLPTDLTSPSSLTHGPIVKTTISILRLELSPLTSKQVRRAGQCELQISASFPIAPHSGYHASEGKIILLVSGRDAPSRSDLSQFAIIQVTFPHESQANESMDNGVDSCQVQAMAKKSSDLLFIGRKVNFDVDRNPIEPEFPNKSRHGRSSLTLEDQDLYRAPYFVKWLFDLYEYRAITVKQSNLTSEQRPRLLTPTLFSENLEEVLICDRIGQGCHEIAMGDMPTGRFTSCQSLGAHLMCLSKSFSHPMQQNEEKTFRFFSRELTELGKFANIKTLWPGPSLSDSQAIIGWSFENNILSIIKAFPAAKDAKISSWRLAMETHKALF